MTQLEKADRSTGGPRASSLRRDFGLLWTGQSLSLFGDQFMVLALPLMSVTVLGVSPAKAALVNFALYLPFLPLGLPAGAIVDRLPRRLTMMTANALQFVCFGLVWLLAALDGLSFPLLIGLVLLSGCGVVFFQVAYTSYLPSMYDDEAALGKANARLALTESSAQSVGPMIAGPAIALFSAIGVIALNTISFAMSLLTIGMIRHREAPRQPAPRERGWIRRGVMEGLRFVSGHPMLNPIVLCGTTYALFLTMVETSLVLYCRNVLGLSPGWIGVVVGAAALGYPVGNLLSTRLSARFGTPRALALSATVSVAGIVSMPALGAFGGVTGACGLVLGSIVHCAGEGSYSPTSLTLRQTLSPPELLGRVGSVQRFLMWGVISVGSLLASGATALWGLTGAMWIGALGTIACLPLLLRRGMRTAVLTPATTVAQGEL
ncbi:MAG TPA: MFS transporter [Streptomyces sp.]|nr:MFS transporter [Streptomyces sp.]